MNDAGTAWNASDIVALTTAPAWLLVLVWAALALQLALSWRATRGAPARVRAGLFALRTAVTVLIAVAVAEPGIRHMRTSRVPDRVVIAVDTSESMGAKEGAKSRAQQAAAAALSLAQDLSVQGAFRPELAFFDETWRAATVDDMARFARGEAQPTGLASDLALPVRTIRPGEGDTPFGGMVIFSDGADTAGLTPALAPDLRDALRAFDAPLHTVVVGDRAAYDDIAIERVAADPFAFVRNPLKVDLVVRQRGFKGKTITLSLLEDGKTIASQEVLLDADEKKVTLQTEPQTAGKHVYSVVTAVLPSEAIAENNRVDFSLKLIRDRIRVLQVAGRPSWDERFVRRMLKENPSVDLISFFILRSTTDASLAANRELSLIPFPTRELFTEQLSTFDAVIFQDFNYRPYQMGNYLQNVKEFVEQSGGGFLMIGGELSFSEGEYDGTAIADVLPVRLLGGKDHLSTESFVPVVTDAGKNHPITDISDVVAGEGFGALPPLEGVNLVAGLAPGAETLLAHPFLRVAGDGNAGPAPAPVVAVREVGRGRTMAIMTDSTWMWSLPHVGNGGRGDAHRRFLANALRWLIRDPELSRVRIAIDAPHLDRGVEPGTAVNFEVRSYNAKYQAEGGANVHLEITPLGKSDRPPARFDGVTGEDGAWRTSFIPPQSGAWHVHVQAERDGITLGADDDAFIVRAVSAEKLHREPSAELLGALAQAGAGRSVPVADAGALTFRDHERVRVEQQQTTPLWNGWPGLLALVALAGAEWWWRRRRGFA